ncbi:adhesion G protein-coupled receptor E2-like [Mytilus californianus]|uniref:adhesion G protein-coupled receptor E2-like n=1 Tax=Mytilus californianus TaxID=6549 RepID=UPI002245FF11|nr:adhesion G protein-coupled receptor E2-like [Mytilus californianus]
MDAYRARCGNKVCGPQRKAVIEPDEYILISPRQARICIDRLQTLNASRNSFNSGDVWNIVAMVFTCISLLCLFLTFLTYCIFPSLRTLPGKNNMCLVFAIFCAQLLFQFVELGTKSDIGCKIIGVLIHYFWLVTFGCLSVCSFHMYRVFTSKTGIRISETSRLVNNIIYSYGTPAIIVSLNIIVTSFSSVTSIGYGSRICFLDQPIAYVVTFAVPISLVCCTNIFFFIATTYKIAKRPKLKNDSQMNLNQIQFTVYAKLFSITGITWIFQIIDSFIPVSAFSTIVSLLNALQGVFIFVSYVCNKRVLSLYNKTRMSFSGYSRTRTSRRTASTYDIRSICSSMVYVIFTPV